MSGFMDIIQLGLLFDISQSQNGGGNSMFLWGVVQIIFAANYQSINSKFAEDLHFDTPLYLVSFLVYIPLINH